MNQKIKDLWNNNKLIFFIALPIIILVFFSDVIIKLIAASSRRIVKEAGGVDSELRKQAEDAINAANKAKSEADKIRDQMDNVEVDEDWHKND